jgi:GNAT superfamily N-acetyltransferase
VKIFIREIKGEDAEMVAALCGQLGYPMSIDQTLKNINAVISNADHCAFVALIDKNIIGWIGVSYSVQIEIPAYCEIHGLVVDDNHHNSGIGKMLIEYVKLWAKQKGTNKIGVHCNTKRTETHKFYEHLGFKEIKQQKVYEMDI